MSNENIEMNVNGILNHLPHRYPMLLVDRVVSLQPGKSIHAYKNVTINEDFFNGHFPHHPIMPGVLIMEALAQAAGILTYKSVQATPDGNSVFYFVGIDNARFKKPVMPGDQLHLHANILRQIRDIWRYEVKAEVDEELVAVAQLMCARRDLE